MPDAPSTAVIALFAVIAGALLALLIYFARGASTESGPSATKGPLYWATRGVAYGGNYLTTAALLGIGGLVAFYGYDGFVYAIGLVVGWVAALLLLAEPMKRLGKFTFFELLHFRFDSRAIRRAAAISTLIVALFFLIPEMVAAGTLFKALLGTPQAEIGPGADTRFMIGVILAGILLMAILTTAGNIATPRARFIKGALLVILCGALTLMLFSRGFTPKKPDAFPRILSNEEFQAQVAPLGTPVAVPFGSPWITGSNHFYRLKMTDGSISTWMVLGQVRNPPLLGWPSMFIECETVSEDSDGRVLVNGKPQSPQNPIRAVNFFKSLPEDIKASSALGPRSYLTTLMDAHIAVPGAVKISDTVDGKPRQTTVYYPKVLSGGDILTPGQSPALFHGIQSGNIRDRLNFLSLMLALFCGAAALPQILTPDSAGTDRSGARKAAVVGVLVIALICMLLLYLGLGAMTVGKLDPSDNNIPVLLLARSLGGVTFAAVMAIGFVIVLETACGLVSAASGAVEDCLLLRASRRDFDGRVKGHARKVAAVIIGLVAMALGLLFEHMNVAILLGWALSVAASANLPAITMLLFWKRTTRQGVSASIAVGLISSVIWIALSADAFTHLFGLSAAYSPMPFNQPGIVTIPLSFLTLVMVSLVTPLEGSDKPAARRSAAATG